MCCVKFKRLKFSDFFYSGITCVLNCEDRLCIFSFPVPIYEIHIIFINDFNLINSITFYIYYNKHGIDVWEVGKTSLNSGLTVTVSVYTLFLLSYLQVSSNEKNLLVLADYS